MMDKKVVIVSAKRTAIGKFKGALSGVSAMELGAAVIGGLLDDTKIDIQSIDEVIMGHVLTAGLGQNTARQSALLAGLPIEVSCFGVNLVCGSGLKSVDLAVHSIISGNAQIVIAGGQESMTRAPFLVPEMRSGKRMGNTSIIDSMINDGLTDVYNHYHMGVTAENIAKKYNITRKEQDKFSVLSQNKAEMAQKAGRFKDEIIPIEISDQKGSISIFKEDEFIRHGTTYESVSKAKPCFIENGTVTAANASGINDGAAAVMLMSEDKAKELGLKILATIESCATVGCEPAIMGIGPVEAIRKVLSRTHWRIEDLDLIEVNEAFSSQSLAIINELKLDTSIVNVNGGAIALGHPIGASGCRILISLIYEMQRRNAKKGLVGLCIGGGMGIAMTISRNN
ncbi:MAG: acetyl-CoA C-acyltransferase [Neisseriaceae bacterium]|nr:MAG: acetyl-CoA C-acyltransferase [Neisseriaceae bacterium]